MSTFAQAEIALYELANEMQARREVTDDDLLAAAEFIRSRILDRTSRGVDASGQPFAEYSPLYAKRKAKAGGRTDQVDLYGIEHHPHMLNALLTRTNPGGFEIGFYGEEAERAEWNNEGTGRLPARRFFAASEEDLEDVREMIAARIDARIRRTLEGRG
jgi:hypothetical protein